MWERIRVYVEQIHIYREYIYIYIYRKRFDIERGCVNIHRKNTYI